MSLRCLLALALGACWAQAWADEAPPTAAEKFVRLERNAAGTPIALRTVIVQWKATRPAEDGVTVDLVGAIHIGDKSYYEALNEAFTKYDAVLYEMVAPAGTRIPKGAKPGSHPVSILQNGVKDLLGLEHQLEIVDYTKENLVHADMSPADFAKSMADRGESIWDLALRSMRHAVAKQAAASNAPRPGEMELLFALFDKSKSVVLKRYLAEQFADIDQLGKVLEGPQGSTLISERNKVAMEELKHQIAAGGKHIAIFYGAAHLPDMQRRLVADFAMRRGDERWLTAWDMPAAPGNAASKTKKRRARKPAAGNAGAPAVAEQGKDARQ